MSGAILHPSHRASAYSGISKCEFCKINVLGGFDGAAITFGGYMAANPRFVAPVVGDSADATVPESSTGNCDGLHILSELYGAPLKLICIEVVRPALQQAGIWSEARERLVLGTGAVESAYKYVKQIGNGPALGWFQCEPATHNDAWQNFILHRPELWPRLRQLCEGFERPGALIAFPQYAAAMCGVHYLRARGALPAAGDAQGMAFYHKWNYNTLGGKTDTKDSVQHFARAIEACK